MPTIPPEIPEIQDGDKLYFGNDNQWSMRRDQATGELVFRHEPTSTDVSKYTDSGEEVNRTTSETIIASQEGPTDFIKMVNETTGDEVRAWVTGSNDFMFSVYDDGNATLKDVFRFDIDSGNLEALNDIAFPNQAGSPGFTTHDHSESSLPSIPNESLSNPTVTINSGNGTDAVGDVTLGDTITIDISTDGVGSEEVADGAIGNSHLGFNPHLATYAGPTSPSSPSEREIWAKPSVIEQQWQHTHSNGNVTSIDSSGDYVVTGDADGYVTVANKSDGSLVWRDSYHSSSINSVATDGDNVYSVAGSFYLHAHNISDGSESWVYNHGEYGADAIAYSFSNVYVGDSAGYVHNVNKSDGSRNWYVSALSSAAEHMSLASGTVGVSTGNTLVGLNTSDGSEQWRHSQHNSAINDLESSSNTFYSAGDGNLCVSTDPYDGSANWTSDPSGEGGTGLGYLSVSHNNGEVCIGNGVNSLFIIDASDGSNVKDFNQYAHNMTADGDSMYIVEDGTNVAERYGYSSSSSINVYYGGTWHNL